MRSTRRFLTRGMSGMGLGLAVAATVGCQTYPAGFGGMTLPSPQYLKHYPQYFPPEPPFPLQRELDSQIDPEGAIRRGVVPVGAPNPLPGGGPIAPPAPIPAPPANPAM